ncbi:hypothetical protein ACMD2_18734, partial [Ananas comosus]
MGVSFKISRIGSRYRPTPPHPNTGGGGVGAGEPPPEPPPPPPLPQPQDREVRPRVSGWFLGGEETSGISFYRCVVLIVRIAIFDSLEIRVSVAGLRNGSMVTLLNLGETNYVEPVVELEASLALNLFPDGFFIGIPTEGMLLPLLGGVPVLHPYDRSSKTLFSAIENGWLPGDILDDIPCKYLNGTIICEVWDYRSCMTKLGDNEPSGDEFPKLKKVNLRMGMENVVKDMLSIADDSWTYNDLL